ncbi:MAG TPA: hypothetical protein VGC74_08010 [Stenotrophomonas sp.]|jgi:hypothetical protein
MNAIATFEQTLPSILRCPPSAHRRRRIGGFEPDLHTLSRFNALLSRLGWQNPVLDRDQLASAARELDHATGSDAPPCIRLRLAQAESIGQMLADTDWQTEDRFQAAAHELIGYVHGDWHLLPATRSPAARLDDAIAVETAWPLLQPEVACYEDFRRLRTLEADHRGCRYEEVAYDRQSWRQAREMEARLLEQRRRIRETSYAPVDALRFRVH